MNKVELERPATPARMKKWVPWGLVAVLILTAILLGRAVLSAQGSQKDLEAELQLQRETIAALREQAEQQDEEKGLIHEAQPVITSSLVSEQLSSLQELVTSEYIYTNSGKYENQNQITIIGKDFNIPFTGKRFIVAYDGRIKVGMDLSEAKIDVSEAVRTVTVTLPKSKIVSHETFEDSLVILDETNNVFNPISIENYNEFVSSQKTAMEQRAIDRGILTGADANAKKIVESFLKSLPGMDTYTLVFR